MAAYKLIYFPLKGRAEMIRLAFAASGVKYEDCRVTNEEFQKLKDSKFELNVCHSPRQFDKYRLSIITWVHVR